MSIQNRLPLSRILISGGVGKILTFSRASYKSLLAWSGWGWLEKEYAVLVDWNRQF